MSWVACFVNDQSGATAIEYAIIMSILGLALGAALPEIGGNIRSLLAAISVHISGPTVVPTWDA